MSIVEIMFYIVEVLGLLKTILDRCYFMLEKPSHAPRTELLQNFNERYLGDEKFMRFCICRI